ncbi:helix-turn-helix transcriptional regulator [uncultured Alistipes sp.]|uniref:helix-turn-helix domain-containing protein n=1 Tax=uncultured Alistipes sp. TaxID=538949 RepID=UPI00344A261E
MKKDNKSWDCTFQKLLVERLRQLKNECALSQEQVIESTHLDISRYETGDSTPSLPSILKLCKLYNIPISEFFAPMNYPPKENRQ